MSTEIVDRLRALPLPVLPEGYVWNIRPHQGDGEIQYFSPGSALLITLDKTFRFFGTHSLRATGTRGYFVAADATDENILNSANLIFEGWQRWQAQQANSQALGAKGIRL